jgi:hypothetical protein
MAGINIAELQYNQNKFWNSATITYSFASFLPNYYDGEGSNEESVAFLHAVNHAQFSDSAQQIVRNLLSQISFVTGLTFVEVTQTSSSQGDMLFGVWDGLGFTGPNAQNIAGFVTDFPGPETGGDVWIKQSILDAGGVSFATVVLHEILHALGPVDKPDSQIA